MIIMVFEAERWEQDAFRELGREHDVRFTIEPLRPVNASQFADAGIIAPFIYSDLSAGVLQNFKNLKLIATRSTGYEHIDIDYCDNNGIIVSNVPVYGENTVAEHVFALILAISHKMCEATDRTRRGDFSLQGLQGFDLKGKTLGVVGVGNIGQYVIEIARGFRMEVLAYDTRPDAELETRLSFRYASMEDLLRSSDIITLHVPATSRTYHLISEREFSMMKKGVVLINTARGSLVDSTALLRALSEGKVGAAGLDVLDEEPVIREEAELLHSIFQRTHELQTLLADHVLLRMRNVVITPHSAFNTREAVQRILEVTIENIEAFLQGQPQNVVTRREAVPGS